MMSRFPFSSPIRAVAFDLDGTLADSLPDLAASAHALRREHGLLPLTDAEIRTFVGDGMGVLVRRTLSGSLNGEVAEDVWERGFAFFVAHYRDHLSRSSSLYGGAAALLQQLQAMRLPLAVVTNKNEYLAAELLRCLGVADFFSLVVGGDTLAERKPSPVPLLHTAAVLGVPAQEMLMVGDSANDFLAARAAACPCAGVTYGYGDVAALSARAETRPDVWVDGLAELGGMLLRHTEQLS